ncbi:hypothetical protein [Blastomonas sp.]|uniref:hypothetical protein n=1 Tax=Blastomonas sp. TaxID=1909299 RepID=UPI00406A97C9
MRSGLEAKPLIKIDKAAGFGAGDTILYQKRHMFEECCGAARDELTAMPHFGDGWDT